MYNIAIIYTWMLGLAIYFENSKFWKNSNNINNNISGRGAQTIFRSFEIRIPFILQEQTLIFWCKYVFKFIFIICLPESVDIVCIPCILPADLCCVCLSAVRNYHRHRLHREYHFVYWMNFVKSSIQLSIVCPKMLVE